MGMDLEEGGRTEATVGCSDNQLITLGTLEEYRGIVVLITHCCQHSVQYRSELLKAPLQELTKLTPSWSLFRPFFGSYVS